MKLSVRVPAFVSIAAFLLLLPVERTAASAPRFLLRRPASTSNNYLTTKELWLNQTLDHFSPYDHRQFLQRYYEYLDHFRVPDGPIFLKICGESVCNGITNDYIGILAKKFGAAVVSLEHRYYGKSSPFKSLSTENLRFLSSKQALFDLAVFRQHYQESLNVRLNRSNVENSWFVFGISYAGAVSAWFRLKFPHLTCGSLASSAVVLSVYNFTDFDKQIGESAGPECKAVLQQVTRLVDQRLEFNEMGVKSVFGASQLKNNGDFLYYLADAAVTAFQYGNPDKLCIPLIEAKEAGKDVVCHCINVVNSALLWGDCTGMACFSGLGIAPLSGWSVNRVCNLSILMLSFTSVLLSVPFVDSTLSLLRCLCHCCLQHLLFHCLPFSSLFAQLSFAPEAEAESKLQFAQEAYAKYVKENYDDVESYDQEHLKETALTNGSSDRLWWFQVCTEVAYFQVAPANDSVRSSKIDTRYHLDLCRNVFGDNIYPDVDATNLYYGGTKIAGSKIVFTNGSQDPWRHASKQISSPEMPSYLIKCHNCGHGTDMRGCPQSPLIPEGDAKNCSSPDAVNKVRQKIIEHIDEWLSDCQDLTPGRSYMC